MIEGVGHTSYGFYEGSCTGKAPCREGSKVLNEAAQYLLAASAEELPGSTGMGLDCVGSVDIDELPD